MQIGLLGQAQVIEKMQKNLCYAQLRLNLNVRSPTWGAVIHSSLLKLPYFDPPRMLAIDPMHNLFLGIAKHHLQSVWIKRDLLDDVEFKLIQERVDKMVVLCDIGRLPIKILSGFSSFTADQFKNRVIHYSVIALHGLLSSNDIECWRTFVLGSRILCSQSVTTEKVKLADLLLLQFCRRTQRQYGEELNS